MSTPSRTTVPTQQPAHLTVVTPSRRAFSADPPSRGSTRRSVHTPLDNTTTRDLLNSVRYGQSASGRKPNAPTPHARAAIRALDLRRATIFTPGRSRRRSLREQRETPRDILRALGQMLAPKSQAIASSSSPADDKRSSLAKVLEEDDLDEMPIHAPRLSLPIDVDDDSDLQPPRSSGLEEENYTIQSIEYPRRAYSEQPLGRLSRGSFASPGLSDVSGTVNLGDERGNFPVVNFEDWRLDPVLGDDTFERIEETEERRNTLARESGIGLDLVPDVTETTFMMNLDPVHDDEPSVPPFEADDDSPTELEQQPPDFELNEQEDDEVEVSADAVTEAIVQEKAKARKRKRGPKISQYGIEYPSLPPAVVKRLAQTFAQTSGVANTKITPDTLDALSQATDWFFEQIGDSLQAYAKHAGRKTIDESDVITLMRRQHQVGSSTTPFSLAQKHLPRELLQHLRMPVPMPARKRRRKTGDNAEEEE
ncbi:hypothetical protein jhhlp_003982 [Lomentospora prolificans]|uniref:CENP-T/Histone H4 histone fold domain-containing protein n=1 Tax=Lomentospora prolificans TaxID=41688 RepID=A0A2N3NAA0_9PEZI|nr:hypothetical protein jhhlp_003982 [Lomentospora prolificans]